MKWLVTGGCGFIGKALVARLMADGGHSVTVLDNMSTSSRDDLVDVVSIVDINRAGFADRTWVEGTTYLVEGDIRDSELVRRCARGADVIVHLAANAGVQQSINNPLADMEINVGGTLNCLEAARIESVKRFVFASSGAAVGDASVPISEESVCSPVSPYGAGKLAGEAYCLSYGRVYELESVALRFGNVYGPGSLNKGSVIAKWIRLGLKGEPIVIYGDGRQTRDFIYIDDLVAAIHAAGCVSISKGEIFQISSGYEQSIGELAEKLRNQLELLGIEAPQLVYSERPKGDADRVHVSIERARTSLRWSPVQSVESGLRQTILWFQNRILKKKNY